MDAVFVDLASRDLKKQHFAKKGDQVAIRTRMLPPRIGWAPLSLSDDVELAQIQICGFPELFTAFQFAAGELSPQRQNSSPLRFPWPSWNKLLILWCREGGSNPHDLAVGGF